MRHTNRAITAERDVPGGRRLALEIETRGEAVPGILLLPVSSAPVPGALLLHGYSSRKEQMAESLGRALLRQGIATLSVDLPLHGSRRGAERDLNLGNPIRVAQIWRLANEEVHVALRFLSEQPAIAPHRMALVGYSLGSYLAVHAATDPLVTVVMLAAGGDLPDDMPFVSVVRTVVDPIRDVRKLKGRPLLMVNGSYDRTIKPAQARRLFEAANDPKQIVWYSGGHWPPDSEVETAARWLSSVLRDIDSEKRHERTA